MKGVTDPLVKSKWETVGRMGALGSRVEKGEGLLLLFLCSVWLLSSHCGPCAPDFSVPVPLPFSCFPYSSLRLDLDCPSVPVTLCHRRAVRTPVPSTSFLRSFPGPPLFDCSSG